MSIIFKGNTDQTISSLRHKRLIEKEATAKSFVEPETSPPIKSATKYHSFWKYFQIMQWKEESNLRAVDWEWTVKSNKFIPVLTQLKAASQSILKIIRCQCKTDCSSRRYRCRKNNLTCSYACWSCRETNCRNIENTCDFSDDEKTSVIMDQNKNSSDHERESTLNLLHAKNTYRIHCTMLVHEDRLHNWTAFACID